VLVRAQALRQVPLFSSLPQEEIDRLAETLEPVDLEPGGLLFREGEAGACCYFIMQGEVEVLKALDTSDERLLAVRGPGTPLGEMGLFSRVHARTASVRARTPLQVLGMQRHDLEGLLQRQPALAFELIQTLSQHLDESENHTVADLREKNRQLQQAYDELKAAQAQLIEKEKLEKELEVARQIQRSLLPRTLPEHPRFAFDARMVPMSAVGGDFYDVLPLADGSLGLAVGDVTGHGVPAALLMALTVTLLRAEARREASPSRVLQAVNRELLQVNDTGFFVTVLYGILPGRQAQFRYARAGHPLPLVLDGGRRPVEVGRRVGQPLGLFEEMLLDEVGLDLSPGGLLFLYTDGITEAVDPQGELFGDERLLAALLSGNGAEPAQACQAVWDALQIYRAGTAQEDDITLLAVGVR
jgi:serine phosphatase RsbU (regulator of sigma subunit)